MACVQDGSFSISQMMDIIKAEEAKIKEEYPPEIIESVGLETILRIEKINTVRGSALNEAICQSIKNWTRNDLSYCRQQENFTVPPRLMGDKVVVRGTCEGRPYIAVKTNVAELRNEIEENIQVVEVVFKKKFGQIVTTIKTEDANGGIHVTGLMNIKGRGFLGMDEIALKRFGQMLNGKEIVHLNYCDHMKMAERILSFDS